MKSYCFLCFSVVVFFSQWYLLKLTKNIDSERENVIFFILFPHNRPFHFTLKYINSLHVLYIFFFICLEFYYIYFHKESTQGTKEK